MNDIPAFPSEGVEVSENPLQTGTTGYKVFFKGMSLRDYFAVHAPHEEILALIKNNHLEKFSLQQIRYAWADEMLAERAKNEQN